MARHPSRDATKQQGGILFLVDQQTHTAPFDEVTFPADQILDRVHAAMLLQASGRANALRALLETEQERGLDFLRLANALSALYPSALYPKDSEERRLLDAMLLAAPR